MKKSLLASLLVAVALLCGCSDKQKNDTEKLDGVWVCELYGSALVIEFTDDGRFIDRTSFTENNYKIENGKIITYVDGVQDSELALEYSLDGDTLVFGGVEYRRAKNINETESDQ